MEKIEDIKNIEDIKLISRENTTCSSGISKFTIHSGVSDYDIANR